MKAKRRHATPLPDDNKENLNLPSTKSKNKKPTNNNLIGHSRDRSSLHDESVQQALQPIESKDKTSRRYRKEHQHDDDDDYTDSEIFLTDDEDHSNESIPKVDEEKVWTESMESITLNIGGIKYSTSMNTISKYQHCKLYNMVKSILKPSEDGSYFIDRNGKYFHIILDFLRNDQLNLPETNREYVLRHLLDECIFYDIQPMIDEIYKELIYFVANKQRLLNMTYFQQIKHVINDKYKDIEYPRFKLIYDGDGDGDMKYHNNDHGQILPKVANLDNILIVCEYEEEIKGIFIREKLEAMRDNNWNYNIHMMTSDDHVELDGFGFILDNKYKIKVIEPIKTIDWDHEKLYIKDDSVCLFWIASPKASFMKVFQC